MVNKKFQPNRPSRFADLYATYIRIINVLFYYKDVIIIIIIVQDSEGETAIHICARDGLLGLAQTLCAFGCNVDLQNEDGMLPLHLGIDRSVDQQIIRSTDQQINRSTDHQIIRSIRSIDKQMNR